MMSIMSKLLKKVEMFIALFDICKLYIVALQYQSVISFLL